jgi:hypothetical protein
MKILPLSGSFSDRISSDRFYFLYHRNNFVPQTWQESSRAKRPALFSVIAGFSIGRFVRHLKQNAVNLPDRGFFFNAGFFRLLMDETSGMSGAPTWIPFMDFNDADSRMPFIPFARFTRWGSNWGDENCHLSGLIYPSFFVPLAR